MITLYFIAKGFEKLWFANKLIHDETHSNDWRDLGLLSE